MTFGDVIVFLIISAMILVSTYVLYRDNRDGKGCGGNCGHCSGKNCSSTPVIEITDEVKKD